MVIISGFPKNIEYRRCNRCVVDSTVPGVYFDESGRCSLCHFHDKLDKLYPENEKTFQRLEKRLKDIKKQGMGKKYDCILGISGGRDSTYLLYLAVKRWNLRPLAVHFNDGFDNPVAGENILKAIKKLGVDLRTITSNFKECKDLKIVDLKASTPLLNNGTDIGIGAALYGVAHKEKIKTIFYAQSYKVEGIRPLAWAYLDGDFLRELHCKFGKYPLSPWKPENPGYNLGVKEMIFYTLRGIKTFNPLYYYPYNKKEVGEMLKKELDWTYPGAHYYDDLYWSLITYVHRVKFNIDFRLIEYSAQIRSGQMEREFALKELAAPSTIEEEKVIDLCIKRLGLTRKEFDSFLSLPPNNFWDYPNSYSLMKKLRWIVWILCQTGVFSKAIYEKYFGLPYK